MNYRRLGGDKRRSRMTVMRGKILGAFDENVGGFAFDFDCVFFTWPLFVRCLNSFLYLGLKWAKLILSILLCNINGRLMSFSCFYTGNSFMIIVASLFFGPGFNGFTRRRWEFDHWNLKQHSTIVDFEHLRKSAWIYSWAILCFRFLVLFIWSHNCI